MKKLLTLATALIMTLSLAACGDSDSSSGGKSSSKSSGSSASKTDGKTGNDENTGTNNTGDASGTVIGVKSDLYAPNVGSQAEKYWHVKEIQAVYEFDKDGTCTVRDTVYYLNSASDYNDAKDELEGGGWKAVWSSDNTYFAIDQGFKDYTTVEDAIDEVEKDFLGYTITYSDGGTKYVEPPTEEQKVEMMKERFGFTFDDIKTSFGDYTYSYTRKRDKVLVTYINGATAEDINALAKDAFEVCKPIADDGKIYDYLGKYGSELSAAPEVGSIFESGTFNYFKDGVEITVQAQILNSEGYDNTLALAVAVVI